VLPTTPADTHTSAAERPMVHNCRMLSALTAAAQNSMQHLSPCRLRCFRRHYTLSKIHACTPNPLTGWQASQHATSHNLRTDALDNSRALKACFLQASSSHAVPAQHRLNCLLHCPLHSSNTPADRHSMSPTSLTAVNPPTKQSRRTVDHL
jgi:hypothetical protein